MSFNLKANKCGVVGLQLCPFLHKFIIKFARAEYHGVNPSLEKRLSLGKDERYDIRIRID